ncbi:nuclear transport factor 2 family protein [Kitasatospora sp. NBC_00085]|uniref:nuclear transport factor 2 family protein n=1 Tax=unclassified Kitasatospora TaxID=2633591 RepID=UPI002F90B6F9
MEELDLSGCHPLFVRQIDCLDNKDIDALMETYHPDAVVVRFQGILTGHKEIRETFSRYMDIQAKYERLLEYTHTGDTLFMRALMSVRGERELGFGAYVLKDGLIWRQVAGIEGGMRDWFAAQAESGHAGEPGGAASA